MTDPNVIRAKRRDFLIHGRLAEHRAAASYSEVQNWTDSNGNQVSDSDGNALQFQFSQAVQVTLIQMRKRDVSIHWALPDRSSVAVPGTTVNWTDSNGNQMQDSSGNNLVFMHSTLPCVIRVKRRTFTVKAEI